MNTGSFLPFGVVYRWANHRFGTTSEQFSEN